MRVALGWGFVPSVRATKYLVAVAWIKRFLGVLGSQQDITSLHVGREKEWWVCEVWFFGRAVGNVASRLGIVL
jgi:hypothetical protein